MALPSRGYREDIEMALCLTRRSIGAVEDMQPDLFALREIDDSDELQEILMAASTLKTKLEDELCKILRISNS